jgi:hypothetical protein
MNKMEINEADAQLSLGQRQRLRGFLGPRLSSSPDLSQSSASLGRATQWDHGIDMLKEIISGRLGEKQALRVYRRCSKADRKKNWGGMKPITGAIVYCSNTFGKVARVEGSTLATANLVPG